MRLYENRISGRAVWLMLAFVLGWTGTANCQTDKSADDPVAEKAEQIEDGVGKPEAPAKVEVTPDASDDEIAERLSSILEASKRFESSEVAVEDGVVFLEGVAKEEEFKQWATDLANKTQDVAAVVNRMTLPEKSIWDFNPAWVELRKFRQNAIQAIPLILFGIIVLLLTWFLARLASNVASRAFRKRIPNELLRWVASIAVMLPILIFGIYIVLRVGGLTQLALTVLGGTGLIGLVIGIAFQDIAENFLASILISVQSPFRKGDVVRIDEYEGIIQRVSTRGTTLMTSDGNLVQVPNSKVYKSTIVNFTASPDRRVSFDIGIGYDDPTSQAQQILLNTVKSHEATLDDPPPRVLIESLAASTVNLRVLFWMDGSKNDWQSVRSSVMRIAKQALQQHGISLPDEAREVIFPNGVPVQMNKAAASEPTLSEAPDETDQTETKPAQTNTSDMATANAQQQPQEMAASEAEGHMLSETQDLNRQAEKSWLPDEGSEILIEDKMT